MLDVGICVFSARNLRVRCRYLLVGHAKVACWTLESAFLARVICVLDAGICMSGTQKLRVGRWNLRCGRA